MKTTRYKYISAALTAIFFIAYGIVGYSQMGGGGGGMQQKYHTHKKADGVGPVLTDQNLVVTWASNTATASIVLQTNGYIYASGSLILGGATASFTSSNMFATNVYVTQSIYATGTVYATGGFYTQGNATAAYYYGDGSHLTGLTTATPTLQSVSIAGASTTTYIQAVGFMGDGSQVTGVATASYATTAATATNASNAILLNNHTATYFLDSTNFTGMNALLANLGVLKTGPTLTLTDNSVTPNVSATFSKAATGNNLFSITTDLITPPAMGSAIQFKGPAVGTAPTVSASGTWSISTWYNGKLAGYAFFPVVAWRQNGEAQAGIINVDNAPNIRVFFASGTEQWYKEITLPGGVALTDNAWHHIVITHSATHVFTFTVDLNTSAIIGASQNDNSPSVTPNTIRISQVGKDATYKTYYDDTRIYSSVLDSTNIDALFAGGVGTEQTQTFDGTLVSEWKMNDAQNSTPSIDDNIGTSDLTDTSGNAYSQTSPGSVPISTTVFSAIDGNASGTAGIVNVGSHYGTTKLTGSNLLFDMNGLGNVAGFDSVGRFAVYKAQGTGDWATMTAGTVTVSTTKVTYSSLVMLSPMGTPSITGNVSVCSVIPGVSFDICSADATDVRRVNWFLIEPK